VSRDCRRFTHRGGPEPRLPRQVGGTALLISSTRTAEPGQHLINIKRALNTSDIYGAATQVLWALACLALAAQAVTGVLMR